MRFVKAPADVRRLQEIYANPQFLNTRSVTVTFETTPEAIAALLPPPLEPTPEPIGTAWVGEVGTSTCVGPFLGAALYVRARYKDIVGNYCITMPMSTDFAVIFGRELYGEPKKLAKIVFHRRGEFAWGSVERYGIRYMSLRSRLNSSAPAGRHHANNFYFKYLPRADGNGFDYPPLLILVRTEARIRDAERGSGELVFRESPHDPVADIPVVQVIEGTYSEGVTYTKGEVLCEVDPEAFLPYAFAKMDAMEEFGEHTLFHAQAARRTREGKGQWRKRAEAK